MKAHVAFITEAKIDSTRQLKIYGFKIYRNDQRIDGSGIMAYNVSSLPTQKLKLPCTFTTLESLALENIGFHDVMFLGIYLSPKGKAQIVLIGVHWGIKQKGVHV